MLYTNDVVVPGCEFSLSLVGFNDTRRKLFASLCNLSKTRKWQYHIDTSEQLGNADITIIAQAPTMSTHLDAMKSILAEDFGCETWRINIKATTTEKLGYIGREEGIAVHAVVLMEAS